MNEILVSLGDEGLKDVAEVLGNSSCVRILEELAGSDLTVSEISNRLGMKLNTVDYNVKKLVRAGLVEKGSHWWSVKGKKMPVYRVTNRRIVISPRRRTVKKFLWVLGLTGAAAIWIRSLIMKPIDFVPVCDGGVFSGVMEDAVVDVAPKAQMLATNAGATDTVVRSVSDVSFWASLAGWEWFLFGAWCAVVLFFVYSLIAERRRA